MRYHHGASFQANPRRERQELNLGNARLAQDFDRAACRFFRLFNGDPPKLSLNDFLVRFEGAIVFNTLAEMNGCQRRAAAFLGLKNTTLNRKVKVQHIRFTKIPVLPGPIEPGPGAGGSPE